MILRSNDISLKALGCVLFFLLFTRLIAMYAIPLNDTTEARYGEIARIMQETGNWITPMHQYGEPFWAKPPLAIWLSAISIKCFGVNALAARLPGLFLSMGILGLIFAWVKQHSGELRARWSVLVLASSIFFLIDAGTVMTDPALLFCITLTYVAFWRAVVDNAKYWGYGFFVALGLGLLAKGPVAVILPGMPIFFWLLWRKQWRAAGCRLPWFWGSLIALGIALPWYGLAEYKTPGFLNYFLLGENIHRFLQPGWTGDKYGYVHRVAFGMIWLYAIAGVLPWSLPGALWLSRHVKQLPALCRDEDGWMLYLLLCTLVPFFFFTFARNIIYPYVFPSLPTFAILFVEFAKRSQYTLNHKKNALYLSMTPGFIFIFVAAIFIFKPEWVERSQQRVVSAFNHVKTLSSSKLVYWAPKLDYSAQFYSKGQAISTLDEIKLTRLLREHPEYMVILNTEYEANFPPKLLEKLEEVTQVTILKMQYRLMKPSNSRPMF